MSIFNQYFYQIILFLLLALAAFLGSQARKLRDKVITTEIKQAIVRNVVRFIEQTYIDIHGPEKLAAAMARASELLQEYGITISEMELITLIEAAVNEFNNAFAKSGQGQHLPGATTTISATDDLPAPVTTATAEEIIADLKDTD